MFELSSCVAVITGAGRGNGAAIAQGIAGIGATVAVCDIDGDAAALVAGKINMSGGTALSQAVDVTDCDAVKKFADKVAQTFGAATTLVNNAGVIHRGTSDDPDYDAQWAKTFAVNLDGIRNMVAAFQDQLAQTHGSIINIGSIMSLTAGPGLTAYAASKGAVAQYTKALTHDLAPKGVRVNAVLPGVIATPMTEETRANPDAIGRFLAHTPMGRVGEPEELVGPVSFLASNAASYVTGALLPVDGGYLAA